MTDEVRPLPHSTRPRARAELRLPGTKAFFDIFNARARPADAMMVSAVGLLGVWVRHHGNGRPGRPMSRRLAYLMDLHIWAIDRHVEDALATACRHGYRFGLDAHDMHYSYVRLRIPRGIARPTGSKSDPNEPKP